MIQTPAQENRSLVSIYPPREQAEMLVDREAVRLREIGVIGVEAEIVEEPAVNVIIGAAESCQPDILVIRARGQSLWPGAHLGSVRMAVTGRVECLVFGVR